jgi:hypothetical protein
MLTNVPDDAQVYVEELESIVEWPGITAGTFRQLLAEIAGFEAMWEQREKAHDAQLAEARQSIAEEEARADAIAAHRDAYRAQLATAKRDGAREALKRLADMQFGSDAWSRNVIHEWRDAEYPAIPKGDDCGWCERNGGHGACKCATPSGELCDADCGCKADRAPNEPCVCATPSPEAREVPAFVLPVVQEVDAYVRITPADAKRIVAMGTEVGDAEYVRGWRDAMSQDNPPVEAE